jgi:uncharacterized protein
MELDRNGMEVLSRQECLDLLGTTAIGRVVVTLSALPAAFPVNFVVHDGDVVFRSGHGTKLQAALRNTVVAFEADGFDAFGHTGWSVLVTGHAAEITGTADTATVERAHLGPWLPNAPSAFIRVSAEMISGRRISLDGAAAFRHGVAVPDLDTPWSGSPLDGCLICHGDTLLPVSDGESANFVCTGCAACWHVEAGWVRRVVPGRCPGCAFQRNCTPAYLADAVRQERLGAWRSPR